MPPQITALGGRVQSTLRKFSLAQKTIVVIGVAVPVPKPDRADGDHPQRLRHGLDDG